jgi:hypothetical protein
MKVLVTSPRTTCVVFGEGVWVEGGITIVCAAAEVSGVAGIVVVVADPPNNPNNGGVVVTVVVPGGCAGGTSGTGSLDAMLVL